MGRFSDPPTNQNHLLTFFQHNDIVVLMIPEFVDIGAPWLVLPMGIHTATLEEVEKRFTTTERRKKLFRGLTKACDALRKAGCSDIYLDGSYVTDLTDPGDYDACWNTLNVDINKLDKVFLNTTKPGRAAQKAKYGGEFFPSSALADGSHRFIQFFQTDKETNLEKGIIRIPLR